MNLQLYPYNLWILYGAIVLLVIFLIMTLLKLLNFLKVVQSKQPQLQLIQDRVMASQQKVESINQKIAQTQKKISPLIKALPILLAIQKIYDMTDDNGIKGYRTATSKYFNQQKNQKDFIKQVQNAIKAGTTR